MIFGNICVCIFDSVFCVFVVYLFLVWYISGAQLSGAQFATFSGWTVGPRTTGPRGPTVRGPICRGPSVRGPTVRGPICLEPNAHPLETLLKINQNGICEVTLKSVTFLIYLRYLEEIGIGVFCDDLITQFLYCHFPFQTAS